MILKKGNADIEKIHKEILDELDLIFSQEKCLQMIDEISKQIKAILKKATSFWLFVRVLTSKI